MYLRMSNSCFSSVLDYLSLVDPFFVGTIIKRERPVHIPNVGGVITSEEGLWDDAQADLPCSFRDVRITPDEFK